MAVGATLEYSVLTFEDESGFEPKSSGNESVETSIAAHRSQPQGQPKSVFPVETQIYRRPEGDVPSQFS